MLLLSLLPWLLKQLALRFPSALLLLHLLLLHLFRRLVRACLGLPRPTLFLVCRLPLRRLLHRQPQLLRYQSLLLWVRCLCPVHSSP